MKKDQECSFSVVCCVVDRQWCQDRQAATQIADRHGRQCASIPVTQGRAVGHTDVAAATIGTRRRDITHMHALPTMAEHYPMRAP